MEKKEMLNDRTAKKVIRYAHVGEKYDVNGIIECLKQRGNLSLDLMKKIIRQSSKILENEPTMLKVTSPMIVVGDIHGQFFDLLNIFQKFGDPSHVNYLFLGDYVDRGRFCIEVMTLVLVLKINYPERIHLLRGNHEGRTMTTFYNFKIQCEKKYDSQIYESFVELFMLLPLSAVIDGKYFAVHGGISPKFKMLSEVEKVYRFIEIPNKGTVCDMLWSDPTDESNENWQSNKMRSCSYFYSRTQTSKFLKNNNIKMIIRGHEVQMKGFKYQFDDNKQPLALTIFSAPRYCDTYQNKGAIAIIKPNHIEIRAFKDVEHPFVLNHYLNAFDLSIPVLAEGASRIFEFLLKTQKVKKTMAKELGAAEIMKKFEDVHALNNSLKINADQINLLLTELGNNQNSADEISQNLLEFIQLKLSELNEKLPLIFGPKSLEFVRIKVNNKEQSDPFEEAE